MSRSLMFLLIFLYLHAAAFAAGSTELLTTIRNGDHAEVEKLLRGNADVNTADSDGTTALMHAVIESDIRMMKLLLDRGANVNAKNAMQSTALMYAATNAAKAAILLTRALT